MQRILEELSRTGIELLLREPFFAHLFGSINKEVVGEGHAVDTLAVGLGHGTLTLFVNARFWDEQLSEPAHRYGVVKHEMLHLVFRHLQIQEPQLDSLLLNVAFDLVVNQYIAREQLPDDSIFLESFPDLQLLPGQTWFYYYKKMEELRQGAGGKSAGTPSAEMLQKIRSDSHGLERHQPWRELRSRSELEKNVADVHLDSLLRTAHQRTNAHAWGAMPGEVKEAVQGRLQRTRADVDWRTVLRLFAGSAYKTRLDNTLKRPSKRYGTTPGLKLRRRQKLLVALDTSGSIGAEELETFFREIYHLWRAGSEVEVVECDVRITRRYRYRGVTPETVHGRGGTDFREPLELANRDRPDAVIYFTDGFAMPPDLRVRVPVLWVLTRKGLEASHSTYGKLPGRKVRLTT
jgi:predicted metal-dependent peptidase